MDVMTCRKQGLEETLVGLQRTGEPLIAIRNNQLQKPGIVDNEGGYYFIPKIANWLNISIDSAVVIFYGGLILLALILSFIWVYKYFKFSKF